MEVGGSVAVRYPSDATWTGKWTSDHGCSLLVLLRTHFIADPATHQSFRRLAPRNKAEKAKPGQPRNIGYAIVIGAVAGLIFLIAIIAVSCHCVRKHRMQSKVASMSMPKSKSKGGGPASGGMYARLPDPEPVDRPAGVFQQPHYDPNVPYATPWSPPAR